MDVGFKSFLLCIAPLTDERPCVVLSLGQRRKFYSRFREKKKQQQLPLNNCRHQLGFFGLHANIQKAFKTRWNNGSYDV